MKCVFCGIEIQGRRHEGLCPYNPINTKKIVIFLRDYILEFSSFNKNFKPFPTPKELDIFLRRNKIIRLKTISKYYLDSDIKISDWLIEIIDYALLNKIIVNEEFPIFIQFLYDAWLFYSLEEYRRLYEQSLLYENVDSLEREVLPTENLKDNIITKLRECGKPFLEEIVSVKSFLTF